MESGDHVLPMDMETLLEPRVPSDKSSWDVTMCPMPTATCSPCGSRASDLAPPMPIGRMLGVVKVPLELLKRRKEGAFGIGEFGLLQNT
jgi:hypothetical protein